MQYYVVLLCLFAFLHAVTSQTLSLDGVNVTRSWSATITSSNPVNFAHPEFENDDYKQCSTTSTTTPYVTFNTTFTTTAVRRVETTCSHDMVYSSILIYITSFNPSAPCTNFYRDADANSQGMSNGEELVTFGYFLFEAGVTYIFVATPFTNDNPTGTIIVNVIDPVATGNLEGQPYWSSIEVDPENECSLYEASAAPYGLFSWTQATTGRFDFSVGFPENLTIGDSWDSNLVLYSGPPNLTQYDSPYVCNNFLEYTGTGDYYANMFYIDLTAGQQYTVLVGGDLDYMVDTWGLFIRPTQIRTLSSGSGFNQPEIGARTCTADSTLQNTAWLSYPFTANSDFAVVAFTDANDLPTDVYNEFSELPVYAFIYLGNNPSTPTGTPSTCGSGLVAAATMEGNTDADAYTISFATTSGQNYTLVVASDVDSYNDPSTKWAYFFAIYSGGYIIPAATTASSTSTSTTTTASTSSSTSSAASSSSTSGTTSTSGSSAASSSTNSATSSTTSSGSSPSSGSTTTGSSTTSSGSSTSSKTSATSTTSSSSSTTDSSSTSPSSSTTDNIPDSATSIFVSSLSLLYVLVVLLL